MAAKAQRRRREAAREKPFPPTHSVHTLLGMALSGIALITMLTFAPIRHFQFVNFDDGEFVVDNPNVATGLTFDNVRWALTHPYVATGGPVTWLSHMLDVEIAGLDAGVHHVTSLALHVCNSLLLLLVLWRLTGSIGRSGFVAALFAVHPLHVESVAWVAQRKDVLSTLFWLLTILSYTVYVRRPSGWRYALVVLLTALGLMSKPMVVTLPVTLLLLDFWPLGRMSSASGWLELAPRLLIEKLPLFGLAAMTALLTLIDQRTLGAVAEGLPLGDRLANATMSYTVYLARTIWPVKLSPLYPYTVALSSTVVALSAIALAVGTAVALGVARRLPYVTFGWLWYVITLLPAIGIVQAGGHATADRATYVPLIGIFVLIAWGAHHACSRLAGAGMWLPAGTIALVVASATAARGQVMHWRDGVSLWQHAIAVDPQNARAHANLGVALASAGRTESAMQHYRESIRLMPEQAQVHNNLAIALARQGEASGAEAHYREAIRLKPDYARAYNNLGSLLASQQRYSEAIAPFSEAVRLEPDYSRARVNLAVALAEAGRLGEAIPHMLEAQRARPDDPQWNHLAGAMLLSAGRADEAIPYLQSAVRLDPANVAARQALDSAHKR